MFTFPKIEQKKSEKPRRVPMTNNFLLNVKIFRTTHKYSHQFLPKLDGDWANNDEFEFNPPDPIKIDDACCCWIAVGGRISDELVGTMLT